MIPSLAPFFAPRSVAVIGASDDPSKVGGSVLANLRAGHFAGRVVPVNSRRARVQGLAAVASIADAPPPIDLAVIAVPAAAVLDTLLACAAAGVPGAVVISAGFREIGGEGGARETALRAWLAGRPLRLLGPNCLGWIRPAARLNLTFAPGMPRTGTLGFFSHSGALCTAILDWSLDHEIGFSLFASLGNQADITETDMVTALADDPETRVIVGYLEGVADGVRFYEALRAAATRKPCVLLKAGRSAEGARAIGSHTGALAGSDRAFDAAVRQAGAVRAETLEELFDVARALAAGRTPTSRRVIVTTNGGGLGILATDAGRALGLNVAPLSAPTQQRLAAALPALASRMNPVDIVGDATPARYAAALQALGGERASHVVMLAPQAATDSAGVARAILAATRGWITPVLGVFAGGARVRAGARALEEGGVPCFEFPERAMRALARMTALAEQRAAADRPPAAPLAVDRGRVDALVAGLAPASPLGWPEAAPLLAAYGIALVEARPAKSPDDAVEVARALGFPVALKILSPQLPHKSDVGGVRLNLTSDEEVRAAAAAMLARVREARPEARLDGVLVQRMAGGPAHELLLGMVRDEQFGPLVMVGFGGVYVEVLGDTATRLAPLDIVDARAMLDELRMAPALRGARGGVAADLGALADTIVRFARLVADVPALAELEINPLLAGPGAPRALDVRGRLRTGA
jgi:acetyl coenzyme A synthetase (ADP forming)-like protein